MSARCVALSGLRTKGVVYPGFRSFLASPWATICRHVVAPDASAQADLRRAGHPQAEELATGLVGGTRGELS